MKADISILIPAYNDDQTIARVIGDAVQSAGKIASSYEIIVINDGSSDKTGIILSELAQRMPLLRVITHKKNKGYGGTIKELYLSAKKEWLFTVPGDYQISPQEINKLLPNITKYDMIIGWRRNRHDPAERLLQSGIYNFLISSLFRFSVHDVNSVRLMKRDILNSVSMGSTSAFVDAELTVKAKRLGYRIVEIPIIHNSREGKGASGGKWWTILPTIAEMLKFWFKSLKR